MAEISFSDFTASAIASIEKGAEHYVAQMAYRIEDVAKDTLHVGYGVDTEAMRTSISAITSEGSHYQANVEAAAAMNPKATFAGEVELGGPMEAAVQVPVDYAGHNELGTAHMAATPFLTPAVELVIASAEDIAREVFGV